MVHDKSPPLYQRRPDLAAKRLSKYGLYLFEELYFGETGRRIPSNYNDNILTKAVFFGCIEDVISNREADHFYDANAYLFRRYAPKACSLTTSSSSLHENFTTRFHGDSLLLLQQHNKCRGQDDFEYGHWAASLQQFFHLYQQSTNAVFGGSISDASIGAATIRLAIEARLKRAVGIFALENRKSGRITGVKMGSIFKILALQRNDYRIAVDLDIIKTIYTWSNNYIHTGMLSPAWLNFYAHELIDPMFVPHSLKEGASWDFGLVMPKSVLESIRSDICAAEGTNHSIFFGTPIEDCAVGLI